MKGPVPIVLSIVLATLGSAGCGDDAAITSPDAATVMPDAQTCLPRATYPLTIDAGAFPPSPDHPSVVVVSPEGFDPTAPTELVVYIHGFDNCVTNIVGDTPQACTPGGALRNAYSLAAQLEQSGRNALLVCPEVAFDQATGNPGQLGTANGMRAMLAETLAALPAPLGPLDVAKVGTVIIASHSGGYVAAAAMATIGGIPVSELWLFDSLYGETTSFDGWVMQDLAGLATTTPSRRFSDVYTSGGGTLSNSQAMAARAAGWVASDPSILIDDRSMMPLPDASYHHGLIFKFTGLAHDDVPRMYFAPMLATSSLSARTCP